MIAVSGRPYLYAKCVAKVELTMMKRNYLPAMASTSQKYYSWLFESSKPQCNHFTAGTDRRAAARNDPSCSFKVKPVTPFNVSKINKLGNWISTLPSSLNCSHRPITAGFQSHKGFHTSTLDAKCGPSKSLSASEDVVKPLLPSESPDTLIETWFYTVAPRGSVHLNLPFNTVVRPLNPQTHPDMDKAIIEIHFDTRCGAEVPPSHELSHIGDLFKLDVLFDQDVARMNVTAKVTAGVTLPLVCMLWVPLQSDLTATVLSDKDLAVEKLEGNMMNLSTQHGNCYLKSLKCGSLNVQCSAGSIISRSTVLGNIMFHTGMSGGIQADKLQGSSVVCQTELGTIGVKSLYADTAIMRTTCGSVQLGQCHGQMLLQAGQSDVNIGSLEGDIDVGLLNGSVNLHLSKHSNSNIDIKEGDIHLSFPDGTSTDLDLDCQRVTLGENVAMEYVDTDMPNHTEGYIGERGKALIHARTLSGIVDIKLLDWIHSTKLLFKQD